MNWLLISRVYKSLFSPQGGVAIANTIGAISTVNANGVSLRNWLSWDKIFGIGVGIGTNIQNQIAAQQVADGLGLGFGTITVIDDLLTVDPHLGSQTLGKAQGVYVVSSADGSRQMMTFTAMMKGGEYGDSINFFGVYHVGSAMSRLSITGGIGKYLHACGFAEVRSLIPAGQIVANGVKSLLRLTVHLSYQEFDVCDINV